ncbi:Unknown protein [Striga hermonthica]|uniref:KIB1-4 beta-propeller domain-containing protein n=1 Tax=Striga hermonthica TaxID=68872 RepID=A0A9N7RA56_STRHE|nr:Unknown protein [Striga hermonthica]
MECRFLLNPNDVDQTGHPRLLVSHGKNLKNHALYNVLKNQHVDLNIPEVVSKLVFFTSYGNRPILIDLHNDPRHSIQDCGCCLLNITFGQTIRIPHKWIFNYNTFFECVLCGPPTEPDYHLIILLTVCLDGACGDGGALHVAREAECNQGLYSRVVDDGEMLVVRAVVQRYRDLFENVAYFKVSRIIMGNENKEYVEELMSIGNRALFLGKNGSTTCFADGSSSGVRRNSIYYYWDDRNLYVYDFEDRSTTPLRPCPVKAPARATSRREWNSDLTGRHISYSGENEHRNVILD